MTARQPREFDGRDYSGREFDVVIVGGGLVGASLAVALAPAGLSLAVVEPVAVDCDGQPSFDERTVALTWNARRIYTGIGVWQEIAAKQAEPIREIHISNRGHFGMTHLGCAEVGVEALGYVVPTRVIGRVLHSRMKQSDAISLLCPATAAQLRRGERTNEVSVLQNGESVTLKARLVVLADGGRSRLAGQVGIQPGTTQSDTTQPDTTHPTQPNPTQPHPAQPHPAQPNTPRARLSASCAPTAHIMVAHLNASPMKARWRYCPTATNAMR